MKEKGTLRFWIYFFMVKENGRNHNSSPDLAVPIEAKCVANICSFEWKTVEMDTSQKGKNCSSGLWREETVWLFKQKKAVCTFAKE